MASTWGQMAKQEGKDGHWRRDGEGHLLTHHPVFLLPAPFMSVSQTPLHIPFPGTLSSDPLLLPYTISFFLLSSAFFQPQEVPLPKGCWLQ